MKKLAVLTGAGISAESGIATFRGSGGLWENHDVQEVASPIGWKKNPKLVLDFYNARRRQLLEAKPNAAHFFLKELESRYEVVVITQNIDDLHERAGSARIIHLHGELLKVRSEKNGQLLYDWKEDLALGQKAADGAQLRPDVVWFGELVPMLEAAIDVVLEAELLLVIGTSLQVYPAASLLEYFSPNKPVFVIDPDCVTVSGNQNICFIRKKATEGIKELPL